MNASHDQARSSVKYYAPLDDLLDEVRIQRLLGDVVTGHALQDLRFVAPA